jgi:thiol:disulfide interchange protein
MKHHCTGLELEKFARPSGYRAAMSIASVTIQRYGLVMLHDSRAKRLPAMLGCLAALACFEVRPAERDIYPPATQAEPDIAAALRNASASHKRVILDFGGNWCTDCRVLDIYFHDSANKALLEGNYVLVHVNIGRMDANVDIAQHFQIPLNKGVPAVAVLDEQGKLLYSQKTGEFEAMRHMQSNSVTEFLVRWKRPAT